MMQDSNSNKRNGPPSSVTCIGAGSNLQALRSGWLRPSSRRFPAKSGAIVADLGRDTVVIRRLAMAMGPSDQRPTRVFACQQRHVRAGVSSNQQNIAADT